MDRIDNQELLTGTIRLLTEALEMARNGKDPQFALVDALGPLQLHFQRTALLRARVKPTLLPLGFSSEEVEAAIGLIDDWLVRLNGDNIVAAYEAAETLRMHYSPYQLLLHLQALEKWKKLLED